MFSRGNGQHFLTLFLPPSALIVLGMILYGQSEVDRQIGQNRSLQLIAVAAGADALRHNLRALATDVSFLAALPRLRQTIADPRPVNMASLAANFAAFAEAKGVYDQIRWIDETGQERVRVNYTDGKAVVVPLGLLQNKADRYYFTESNRVGVGRIYLSPFDLNIEHGQVEKPDKPTLRLGTPVADAAGAPHGVLILNYLGQNLLDAFAAADGGVADPLMLLNGAGFWLRGPEKADEWGFMFQRADAALASRNPAAWSRIQAAGAGQVELSDGLWTWQTVTASEEIELGIRPPRRAAGAPNGGELWKAVSLLPEGRLSAIRARAWTLLSPIALSLIALTALGSALLARSQRRVVALNNDLVRRAAEADAANQAKARFLANMSHEIRTPMNAIQGLAYLLESAPLRPDERDLVRKIRVAGRALLGTINDILDVSKIEAGRLELERAPFRLADVLDQVAAILSTSVAASDLELVIGPPPAEAAVVVGDALRLQQVLVNLVSNAIKFTQAGDVTVQVAVIGRDGQRLTLRFSVRDTGVGIPADQQSAIFAPFAQADSSTTRRFGGTGLGLTISRHLVAAMGGEMGLTSQPGRGSEFWFTVPLTARPDCRHAVPTMANLHLLIVDDNAVVREILQATAQSLNWTAEAVGDGEAAVARFRTAVDGRPPCDVVLIDWAMPGLDGLATARAVRRTVRTDERPLLVIMVAPFARSELTGALAGEDGLIDGVITKPVTGSTLFDAIGLALRRRDGQDSPAIDDRAPRGRRLDGLRVLVVDDNEINREVACRILNAEGAAVSLAEDGQAALSTLRDRPDGADVVLMDVQMPIMDGYEACRRIRAELGLTELPVIALTAGAFRNEQDAALAAGMNGFIAKPIDVDQMVATLQRLGPAAAVPPPAEPPSADGGGPALDVAAGLRQWGDEAAYRKYLDRFAVDYSATGRQVAEMLAGGDTAGAARLLHTLKGVAGNLALPMVVRRVEALEIWLSSGGDGTAGDGAAMAAALQDELDAACRAIAQLASAPASAPAAGAADQTTAELLHALLRALGEDSPDAVEPIVATLADRLSAEQFSGLAARVDAFDFRGAEVMAAALVDDLAVREEE